MSNIDERISQLSASEMFSYTTVRIECELSSGLIGSGTGFFYVFAKSGTQGIPAIITNKHVVEDAHRGSIQLHLADESGKPQIGKHFRFEIPDLLFRWVDHPDPDIDLCVLPITPILTIARANGVEVFFIHLDQSKIPDEELLTGLSAIEDVIMVGYPTGLWDEANNMPIARRGITATHPNYDYDGRPEFMIDMACFPGSSGSPVFLYNLGHYADRQGSSRVGSRIALLGILYAGPVHTIEGKIEIADIPTEQLPTTSSQIPINLGYVIKSQKLNDFESVLLSRMLTT